MDKLPTGLSSYVARKRKVSFSFGENAMLCLARVPPFFVGIFFNAAN